MWRILLIRQDTQNWAYLGEYLTKIKNILDLRSPTLIGLNYQK
jgi:hypothetical protein